jgi:hypothetical protein
LQGNPNALREDGGALPDEVNFHEASPALLEDPTERNRMNAEPGPDVNKFL